MSENKKYIGLTLGPIYKTIGGARKTIELWAASYTFSHLMKKVIEAIGKEQKTGTYQVKILNPLADPTRGDNMDAVAGLYPDRLVLESKGDDDFKKTVTLVEKEVKDFAKKIADNLPGHSDKEKVKNGIVNYLQAYLVMVPDMEAEYKAKGEKWSDLIVTNQHLDATELQASFKAIDPIDEDYLSEFFKLMRKKGHRGKLKDVFGLNKIPEVQSLEYIALHSLSSYSDRWDRIVKEAENDEDNLMPLAKKEFKEEMKKHHSYVAIVHADGDSVGKTIKAMKGEKEYQEYCSGLMDFGREAIKKIDKFGGLPIYAGGDDLLFFAPMQSSDGGHIFGLLENLDSIFSSKVEEQVKALRNSLKEGDDPIPMPSLSFGVSITYYKFPLYEALEMSRNLLFGKAKKQKGKHAVALNILLHSGHAFSNVFSLTKTGESFTDKTYGYLRQMLGDSLKQENLRLNSVTHAMSRNQAVLGEIGSDKVRMKAFFDNTFDEDIHKSKSLQPFWQAVRGLMSNSFSAPEVTEMKDNYKASEKAIENASSVLRILHFLNQDHDER